MEENIEVTVRRGRRRRQLLDYLKETRGCCKLKGQVPNRSLWSYRFERDYGPVTRRTVEGINANLQCLDR